MQDCRKVTTKVVLRDLTMKKRTEGVRGNLSQNLWTRYLKIYHQSSINGLIFGGIVRFEPESAYKLNVVSQQEKLSILRIELLSSSAHMNHGTFEVLFTSSVFEILPQET